MLARLIQDEPAMRSACEDAFEAPETIDDEQDTRGFEDVVVDRRVSVPESVAVSLPSLKEGDEEAVEEAVADGNDDEMKRRRRPTRGDLGKTTTTGFDDRLRQVPPTQTRSTDRHILTRRRHVPVETRDARHRRRRLTPGTIPGRRRELR
jgi:hypothetical protein